MLYKENWTAMANLELIRFQGEMVAALRSRTGGSGSCLDREEEDRREFSLATAFFYCLSLATTVGKQKYPGPLTESPGYDGGVPTTPLGKLISVAIACVGLPIFLLYICLVGSTLARRLQVISYLYLSFLAYSCQPITILCCLFFLIVSCRFLFFLSLFPSKAPIACSFLLVTLISFVISIISINVSFFCILCITLPSLL